MPTMPEAIEIAFINAVANYKEILVSYHPAIGNNGFTERNQTCYFVANLLKVLANPDTPPFAWYEMPIQGEHIEAGEHMDAIVFAPSHNAIVYVEAKRISDKGAVQEIFDDITRMHNRDMRNKIRAGYNDRVVPARQITNEFIVYLADVWESPNRRGFKKQIRCWWHGNQDKCRHNPLFKDQPPYPCLCPQTQDRCAYKDPLERAFPEQAGWPHDSLEQLYDQFVFEHPRTHENYYMLMGFFKDTGN